MTNTVITLLGAGSVVFAKDVITDILLHESLRDCELRLLDVDAERLETAGMLARAVNREIGARASVVETTDRRQALDGADFVICTIGVGGSSAARVDLEIPHAAGLCQTIGDSLGVGGIFRAVRSIPVLLAIAHEMEQLCPDALLVNYSNPMAMNMLALQRGSRIRSVGLCHGLVYTARTLRTYVDLIERGVPDETINDFMNRVRDGAWRYSEPWGSWVKRAEDPELHHVCLGINHMAFFLKFASGARDLYPAIREASRRPAIRRLDSARFELFDRLGYFMTETTLHTAEYVPWIMRHDGERDRLEVAPNAYLDTCERQEREYRNMRHALQRHADIVGPNTGVSSLDVSRILNSMVTGQPHVFNGNVHNAGGKLIANLPGDCCVEVPCLADRAGVRPLCNAELPPQCAALIQSNVSVQDLAVRGIMEGSRGLIRNAMMIDPNTAATLTLPQIDDLCERMFKAHQPYLAGTFRELQ